MHKKSIEAAETLKSSDENSDKDDDEPMENSDTSSVNNNLGSPLATVTIRKDHNFSKATSNGSPCSSSMSPPIINSQSTPIQRPLKEATKGKDYSLMSSPSRGPSGFLTTSHEQPQQNTQHAGSHTQHHTLPVHHYSLNPINQSPDTDPEVFRWVSYHPDYPVSFIR